MENQVTLQGQKANIKPPVMTGIFKMFSQKDSIWQTLKFFYNAYIEGIPYLMKEHIRKAHNQDFRVSHNTIENNLRRLMEEQLILVITTHAGKTRRAYKYRITEKGFKWFNSAINKDLNWCKTL